MQKYLFFIASFIDLFCVACLIHLHVGKEWIREGGWPYKVARMAAGVGTRTFTFNLAACNTFSKLENRFKKNNFRPWLIEIDWRQFLREAHYAVKSLTRRADWLEQPGWRSHPIVGRFNPPERSIWSTANRQTTGYWRRPSLHIKEKMQKSRWNLRAKNSSASMTDLSNFYVSGCML